MAEGDRPLPSRPAATWLAAAAVYARPRILAFLFLGFSSGLPLALTAGTLSIWLTEAGMSLTAVGLFAAVGTPYSLKFFWSPIIDRAPFPVLTRLLGRRRGWMVATQAALMASLLALGGSDPRRRPATTAVLALLVAFCSASQDIVIDAYRIERLPERELGAGAAMQVFGYRVGMLVSGAGALLLASYASWPAVYATMAGLIVVGAAAALLSPEPLSAVVAGRSGRPEEGRSKGGLDGAGRWLTEAVVHPFAEFMGRPGWVTILLFVMFFKFGDTLAATMTSPFLLQIGFSKIEIAEIAKVYGFGATMIGLALGGALINGTGLVRSLWITGILQLVSNLMFAVQAAAGHDLGLLALTVGFENLAGGMGTAAFVAYLSSLCNVAYTATQYALLTSFMAVARTWLSSPGGWMAEKLAWIGFFLLTTIAAVPGLVLLARLTRRPQPIPAPPS